ncbi:unnamed protein product [Clonostachys chloroleuca]|uniref:Uncharacterized protein n=1 Tax=Clonostachys chloroleuca TaxID=1926264 RepID=A0AA35M2U6_9HYPO|nr:unnamed protein product [Clonostachys chloroleuca]
MTTTAAPMDVPDDGIACDAPTNDVPPPRRPNNDNTRSEQSGRWTPEPQPATFDTLTEWGRKHLGEKWTTERESMIDDAYNSIAARDPTTSKRYCERQKELRDMERELQRGKVELIGRELDELTSLARKRYGEGWYLNRRAARREQEMGCAAKDFSEKMHHSLRTDKRRRMASKIMEARDEAMLSEGYSWDQILGSSQPPNAIDDTDDTEACTPAMSEVNNPWVVTEVANTSAATEANSPRAAAEANSELEDDDAPTNESEYAKEAKEGPKHGTVERLEWGAVADDWDDERYERARFYGVGAERSRAENEECTRRYHSEGPKAKKKREEREAHFFRVQHQAVEMFMELDGLDENPAFSDAGRYRDARARLDDYHKGDFTKLPDLELIAQELGIRRSLPEHHDGLSSGSGQEPTAPPKQQQRKRPGSPQHHERRQSRRLRQLPVEYKPEDPDKIIRLANAARRRGL